MIWTHGVFVEVEQGGAEKLFSLGQDLVSGGTGIRRRGVIKRRHFREKDVIVLFLGKLREAARRRQKGIGICSGEEPFGDESLHLRRQELLRESENCLQRYRLVETPEMQEKEEQGREERQRMDIEAKMPSSIVYIGRRREGVTCTAVICLSLLDARKFLYLPL